MISSNLRSFHYNFHYDSLHYNCVTNRNVKWTITRLLYISTLCTFAVVPSNIIVFTTKIIGVRYVVVLYEYVHQHGWWNLNDRSPWHWLGKGANSVRTKGTRCVYRAISHTWAIRRTMTASYSRYTRCRDVTEWRGECAAWRTLRHIARVLAPHA